jgi:hypothetical protein
LPPGLSINAASGLISGSLTTTGTYSVTAQVSDSKGGSASRSFSWSVAAANQPPALNAVANQSGTVGQSVSLQLSASDPDGDVLTYSASGLPQGLSLVSSTGLIRGALRKAGSFAVTVTVVDGRGGSASRSFTWTVLPK